MPATGMDILRIQKIAQAQAWQRAGRAGRQAAGFCYRTYTLSVICNEGALLCLRLKLN